MSEASDKHDEQCANLKKAAAICEQRGQGLVDSVIALQAEVEELTKAITDFREGNYPDPRSYRPNNCPHGTHYWQECANCDEEYWQSVLQEGE